MLLQCPLLLCTAQCNMIQHFEHKPLLILYILHVLYSCTLPYVWLWQVRCLEEENESLEAEIIELEERLESEQITTTTVSISGPADYSLEAVIERLRKEKVPLRNSGLSGDGYSCIS